MRRVLSVGQCGPDTAKISGLLNENFEVEVACAESHDEAIQIARDSKFDLIMLNRILDATGTEGIEILRALKMDPTTSETPVMMISNFEDAQQQAVADGAVPGFGKAALVEEETIEKLRQYLAG